MYIGYAFFYFTRKSFTFAMPAMMIDLGFTKSDLGILSSILYISYGLSKFVSGVMSDRSNPRYFMAFGLILTGIFNIFFGLSSSIVFFALFWGLNGWFQGWGWPPCARLLTHWYAQEERGTWWGIWNTCHNVGGSLIPLIVAMLAQMWGWRISMFVPGVLCIMIGFFLIDRLRDTPESLGLPPVEKFRGGNYIAEARVDDADKRLTQRELLWEYVLKNKSIWILGCAYFFVYVIRAAVNDWGQLFLYEQRNFSLIEAGTAIFCFELGGFFGNLAAGWLSDKVFGGKRGPVNFLFSAFVMVALIGLWYTPHMALVFAGTMMFCVGFFIFGPQMLIGVSATELSHKKAAGTVTGFIGCFSYLGAAVAGYPCGKILQDFGWEAFFVVLVACALIAVLFLFPLMGSKKRTLRLEKAAT